MIIRIFRIRVLPEQRESFERDFQDISLPYVKKQPGLVSMSVGNPTIWKPDDYLLITNWDNEQALINFAGANWNEAVIPAGMEKYVVACWVDHFEETYQG